MKVHFFQDDGRKSFWSVNGPRILQVGYEDEEDPKVMEAYELIGSLVYLLNFLVFLWLILVVHILCTWFLILNQMLFCMS